MVLNSRGQGFAVFEMLQGAVIAIVMLGLVYGVILMVQGRFVSSDPLTIGSKMLSSAYASAGTSSAIFRGKAHLADQEFTVNSLLRKAGVPDGTAIKVVCKGSYCDSPGVFTSGDNLVSFHGEDNIEVCAVCANLGSCVVNFDAYKYAAGNCPSS